MDISSLGSINAIDIASLSMVNKAEETARDHKTSVIKNAMDTQSALSQTIITQLFDEPGKLDMLA